MQLELPSKINCSNLPHDDLRRARATFRNPGLVSRHFFEGRHANACSGVHLRVADVIVGTFMQADKNGITLSIIVTEHHRTIRMNTAAGHVS